MLPTSATATVGAPADIAHVDPGGHFVGSPVVAAGTIVVGGTAACVFGGCEVGIPAAAAAATAALVGAIVGKIVAAIMHSDKLTPEAEKGIKTLGDRIKEHEKKLEDFRNAPTPRPGSEQASDEVKDKQIQGRIGKLEREIKGFKKAIEDLKSGKTKPTPRSGGDKKDDEPKKEPQKKDNTDDKKAP